MAMSYFAQNIRIIDADTLKLDVELGFGVWMMDKYVRIWGIDTPERRSKDKLVQRYASMSENAVRSFLGASEKFRLHTCCGVDKFGRILGDLVNEKSECLSKILLDGHYAVKYDGKVNKAELEQAHLANRIKLGF